MKQKVRKLSIRLKLLVPVGAVILVVCSLLSAFSYLNTEHELVEMGRMQAQTVAHGLAKNTFRESVKI